MNIDDLPEDLDETVRTMSKRLSQGDGHMMTQYEALKNDLQFTTAGNQWARMAVLVELDRQIDLT